jgi:hypothetical protein
MYKFIIYSYFSAGVFLCGKCVVRCWGSVWWLGGFVVEDSGIGFVKRWWGGFGIGHGLGDWGDGVMFGGESDAATRVEGIGEIDGAGAGKNGWKRREDGVLKSEGGFGSALPEAGEEHEEETKLGEQKRGPDARLGEHVHCGAGSQDDGGESEEREEKEDGPGFGEVTAKGSPRGGEGAANAAVRFGLLSEEAGAKVLAELNGVDLDEVEVETEDGGDEEEDDVAGEDEEEGGAAYDVVVDVVCPFALEEKERAEDEGGDEEGEEGDADEAPEMEDALLEEGAETSGGVGLVAEECAGDEEEVDDEKKWDGGVAGDGAGVAYGTFVEMEVGFADGAEIEAAGETLGGEGVVEQFGELKVEADGEEEGQGEIEDVGPEERGEAAQS